MKVLAIGASNSKNSINKKFATYAAMQLKNVVVESVDLNDYSMPIYGIDLENDSGIPDNAKRFSDLVKSSDGIVLSLAEHNSNFTAVFKNLTDWMSRLEGKTWHNKKIFLLSTSPGGRGGAGVMNVALNSMPYSGADIVSHFSLPKFNEYFSDSGISDSALNSKYRAALSTFQMALQT